MTPMTGLDLKLKRITAGVKAQDVAAAMGISSGRISRIESQSAVTLALGQRYLDGLDRCSKRAVA